MTTEGRVIGAERSEMQIIRNFIGQADNADHPQKKYGRVELVGRSPYVMVNKIITNFI